MSKFNHFPLIVWGRRFLSLVQVFLVAGHLTQYRIRPNSLLYKRRKIRINLLDAYVLSGFYSSLLLPDDELTPTLAKRYDDGLEVDDSEEETLFTICHREDAPVLDGTERSTSEKRLPKLKSKMNLAIFRARSKLERDGWCWAINTEIDRLQSTSTVRAREEQMREMGLLSKK